MLLVKANFSLFSYSVFLVLEIKTLKLKLKTGSISHQIYLLSPEVCAAGAENHLVGLETLALGGQGDVDEVLLLEQVLEGGGERELVVVPLQAELVRHSEEEKPR